MSSQISSRPVPSYQITDYDIDSNFKTPPGMNYMLKPGADCCIRKPSWNGTLTVIRPYPCVKHDDPKRFWPYRIDPGGRNYFGFWIRKYSCAWRIGDPPTTFIIGDPYSGNFNVNESPLAVLYRQIEKVCRTGQAKPEWYALREGNQNGRILRQPDECFMIQGALLSHDGQDYFDCPLGWGDNPPCILVMSQGCGRLLMSHLSEERPDYRGDPGDFEQRYVCGDPVAVDKGRFIVIFQKGHDPRTQRKSGFVNNSQTSPQSWQRRPSRTNAGKYSNDGIGFDLYLTDQYGGHSPKMNSQEQIEVIRSKWRFWEDVIHIPSYEEQARIMSRLFPASALLYAWSGYRDWITDDIRKSAANAVSAMVNTPKTNPQSSMTNPFADMAESSKSQPQDPFTGDGIDDIVKGMTEDNMFS